MSSIPILICDGPLMERPLGSNSVRAVTPAVQYCPMMPDRPTRKPHLLNSEERSKVTSLELWKSVLKLSLVTEYANQECHKLYLNEVRC